MPCNDSGYSMYSAKRLGAHDYSPLVCSRKFANLSMGHEMLCASEVLAERGELNYKGLKTYASLSRIGFPKSYSGKIMLVAFAGTYLPLAALLLYLLLVSPGVPGTHFVALAALLIATLLGFAVTLWALRALLAPVRLASSSLKSYLDERKKPGLPIGFPDEAGRLMAYVQYTVENLDTTIRSLQGLSDTDYLTEALNRRGGEARLRGDLARAKRGSGGLRVALS